MTSFRDLPSVERLLGEAGPLVAEFGRPLTLNALRQALEQARAAIREGSPLPDPLSLARTRLLDLTTPSLRPAINATGVIVHTNLGRAPLSVAAIEAMRAVAAGYSTLEYDLAAGERGSRDLHTERVLTELTGAEAALVVNNNAAAVLLALTVLARGQEVLISRGQLVEIGGGFRVPDVLRQSGARLVEVGTTNRTHLRDYEAALSPETALILRVHASNFRILGFTTQPELGELAALAGEATDQGWALVRVMDDIGSGALLDTAAFGLAHEPTVQESLAAGADLVAFSGDKLLGGPQAGILAGAQEIIADLRRHPLARAVRADKLCLAGLGATLLHYLRAEATRGGPVWRVLAESPQALGGRAAGWAAGLGQGEVVPGRSTVGGGSLPGETLESRLLALAVNRPDGFVAALRAAPVPIIARIEADHVVFDPRTVLPEQEAQLLETVRQLLER